MTAQATTASTEPAEVDDTVTVAASDPSEPSSGGLLADIELDQLILVLIGFGIAIGLTLSGALRAWRRGPI